MNFFTHRWSGLNRVLHDWSSVPPLFFLISFSEKQRQRQGSIPDAADQSGGSGPNQRDVLARQEIPGSPMRVGSAMPERGRPYVPLFSVPHDSSSQRAGEKKIYHRGGNGYPAVRLAVKGPRSAIRHG